MGCQTTYSEMMSLLLDDLLDPDEQRRLHEHISGCALCATLWSAMKEADSLVVASTVAPASVPANFTVKVMERIALTPVIRPDFVHAPAALRGTVPAGVSVLPPMPVPIEEYEEFPIQMPDYVHEWQNRIAAYVRGMAAVGLTLAGVAGLLLALVLSGSLRVGQTFAPAIEAARTFFSGASVWLRSLFAEIGIESIGGAALVLALLAFAGWQLVSNYHRAASTQPLEPAFEAAS